MNSTPWGEPKETIVHGAGFATVITETHNGIRINAKLATRILSSEARDRALLYGKDYFYDGDVNWAIPLFESKVLRKKYVSTLKNSLLGENKDDLDVLERLTVFLSKWHCDYLLSVGAEPVESLYKEWVEKAENQRKRENKDPDLIIGVESNSSLPKGEVIVKTADNNKHKVNLKRFRAVFADTPHNLSLARVISLDND